MRHFPIRHSRVPRILQRGPLLGLASLVFFAATACGDDSSPPPPPLDAGADTILDATDALRDASDASDASDSDVDDGAAADGSLDAAADSEMDSTVVDDASHDADRSDAADTEPPRDTAPPPLSNPCADVTPTNECAGGCADGSICVDDICGGRACVSGRPCSSMLHCGGNACVVEDGNDTGVCRPTSGGCTNSTQCPLGFSCEGLTCIDRRVPCGIVPSDCPRGYACMSSVTSGQSFCSPLMARCVVTDQCAEGLTCSDMDGDGDRECTPVGACESNDDCNGDDRCSLDPQSGQTECNLDGVCGNGNCSDGRQCVDLSAGNAAPLCVVREGACSNDLECAAGEICAALNEFTPPQCVGIPADSA